MTGQPEFFNVENFSRGIRADRRDEQIRALLVLPGIYAVFCEIDGAV